VSDSFEYLAEIDFIFEINSGYESGDREGSFGETETEVSLENNERFLYIPPIVDKYGSPEIELLHFVFPDTCFVLFQRSLAVRFWRNETKFH
jgi:hypothetical protein